MPGVDDGAEQLCGFFGIVNGGVGFAVIPLDTGGLYRFGEHRLTIDQSSQGDGVKGAEGVEGVTLEATALHCSIEEAEVEEGVMSYQDGAVAAARLDRFADRCSNLSKCLLLRQCLAKG